MPSRIINICIQNIPYNNVFFLIASFQLKQFTSIIQSKACGGTSRLLKPETPDEQPSTNISPFKTPSKSSSVRRNEPGNQRSRSNNKNLNTRRTTQRRNQPTSPPKTSKAAKEKVESQKPQQQNGEDAAMKDVRLRIYRQKVEQRLKARLVKLIDQTEQTFQEIHLNLGPRMKFPSPWRSLDWNAVERRCRQRFGRKRVSETNRDIAVSKMSKMSKKPKLGTRMSRSSGRPLKPLETQIIKKIPGRPGKKSKKSPVAGPSKKT